MSCGSRAAGDVEVWTSPGGSGLTPSGEPPALGLRGREPGHSRWASRLVGPILGFGGLALPAHGALPADCCPPSLPCAHPGADFRKPGRVGAVCTGRLPSGGEMHREMRSQGVLLWNWDTAWGALTAPTCLGGIGRGVCPQEEASSSAVCPRGARLLSHRTQGPQHHGTDSLCPPGMGQSGTGVWPTLCSPPWPSLARIRSHLAETTCLCPCVSAPDRRGPRGAGTRRWAGMRGGGVLAVTNIGALHVGLQEGSSSLGPYAPHSAGSSPTVPLEGRPGHLLSLGRGTHQSAQWRTPSGAGTAAPPPRLPEAGRGHRPV